MPRQVMSQYNRRRELVSKQVTGDIQDAAGVYARLMDDREGVATFDVRYFGWNEARQQYKSSRIGLIFNWTQARILREKLDELFAEATARGLT